MIQIYQIQLTTDQVAQINAEGHDSVPAQTAKLAVQFWGAKKFKPEMIEYYSEAYRVDTDDLDQAYEWTNLWNNQAAVDCMGDRNYSTSVGDIMRCNERFYIVDMFGFTEINLFDDSVAMLEGWELV